MKKIILFCILVLFFKYQVQAQNWEPIGPSDFNEASLGEADYISIAFDTSGAPCVAFQDGTDPYYSKATVRKFNGNNWGPLGTSGFSAGEADYTSMAIDKNNIPYVVYSDASNNGAATVMKYVGNSWVTVGTPGFSGTKAINTSIAIDSSGVPYVAFQDFDNGFRATVMKYYKNQWITVGNRDFSDSTANYISLALDNSGTPYVVFEDYGDSLKASVMKYNGNSWEYVGNQGISIGQAWLTSIAMDSADSPIIMFLDVKNYSMATVMEYVNSKWINVGNPGFSPGEIGSTSITVDKHGRPYVVFSDEIENYNATVMKYADTGWVILGNPGFITGGAGGFSPLISMNKNGMLYVTCQPNAIGFKTCLMEFNGTAWKRLGYTGFSSGDCFNTTMAINKHNIPYVLYEDDDQNERATVMNYSDSVWSIVGSAGFSDSSIQYPAIAIDNRDTPYVAYCEYSNYNLSISKVEVKKINGGVWVNVGNNDFSGGEAAFTSIALDSNRVPYICYVDSVNNFKATVVKLVNGKWVPVGKPGFTLGEARYTSIAIDNNGTPYIVYSDASLNNNAAVMKYNGTNWEILGNRPLTSAGGECTSIKFDRNNIPYVLYQNYNDYNIDVKLFDGKEWKFVGDSDFVCEVVDYNFSLALDSQNTPYVAFEDESTRDNFLGKASVMRFDGNEWTILGEAGFSACDVNSPALCISDNGIAYFAYTNGGAWGYKYDLSSILSIARVNDEKGEMKVYPNPAGDILTIMNGGFNNDKGIKIYNLYGQVLISQTITGNSDQFSIDVSTLIPGIYFIDMSSVGISKVAKFIKD